MANDSPKSAASPSPAPEKLEVPTVPPPSSRFVLPPPPSDLMNRLAAFLPQIRTANEMLAQGDRMEGEEEGVTLEEMSSSDEDSSDEDSSSEESDEEVEEGGETDAAAPLAHLLDISARPKVTKKKLEGNPEAVVEGGAGGEKRAVGIVEMDLCGRNCTTDPARAAQMLPGHACYDYDLRAYLRDGLDTRRYRRRTRCRSVPASLIQMEQL